MAILNLPLCNTADCAAMYMCISCTCTQPMMGLELVRTCGLTANGANGLCCVACHDLLYIYTCYSLPSAITDNGSAHH